MVLGSLVVLTAPFPDDLELVVSEARPLFCRLSLFFFDLDAFSDMANWTSCEVCGESSCGVLGDDSEESEMSGEKETSPPPLPGLGDPFASPDDDAFFSFDSTSGSNCWRMLANSCLEVSSSLMLLSASSLETVFSVASAVLTVSPPSIMVTCFSAEAALLSRLLFGHEGQQAIFALAVSFVDLIVCD